MKNITNAYLVLSVAEIRAVLAAAELEQKFRGENRESVCICLEDITVLDCGQITSWSIAAATENCARELKRDLAIREEARAIRAAAATTNNHSDAAI